MDPDDFSDEQLMRMITLGMAAVFVQPQDANLIFDVAEGFARYIETGERP